jgi:hypothetical protein
VMTSPYSRAGSITSGASRTHIEQALVGYGATDVRVSGFGDRAAITFKGDGRQYSVALSLPQPPVTSSLSGRPAERPDGQTDAKIHERDSRRFWHALAETVDAKLNAAAAGTATLESEFLAHVVLPGNRTVLEELQPIIESAYRSGRHPSFGIPVPSLPVTEPAAHGAARHPRPGGVPPATAAPEDLQALSAHSVGKVLHQLLEALDDHGNLTRQQMLAIIDHELGQNQPGERPTAHHTRAAGSQVPDLRHR